MMTCGQGRLSLHGGDQELIIDLTPRVLRFIVEAQQTVTARHFGECFVVEAVQERTAAGATPAVEGLGVEGVPQQSGFEGHLLLIERSEEPL